MNVEFHYDFRFTNSVVHALQPYAFVDGANTWYIHRCEPDPSACLLNQSIASVGGGLRAWFPYNLTASAEVAQTLNRVVGSDGDKRATKILVDLAVRF